ncbi:hypothetical protein [Wukongibacter sp. M2B1]|uniref:hypothetical protein n=1 Tax=Wukongibacter sp. M2B1 TaxID=3088895 RepID=UPI003D792CAE
MKEILTKDELRLEAIVLEHTNLANEYISIYNLEGAEERLQEIKQRVAELRTKRNEIMKRMEGDKCEKLRK